MKPFKTHVYQCSRPQVLYLLLEIEGLKRLKD